MTTVIDFKKTTKYLALLDKARQRMRSNFAQIANPENRETELINLGSAINSHLDYWADDDEEYRKSVVEEFTNDVRKVWIEVSQEIGEHISVPAVPELQIPTPPAPPQLSWPPEPQDPPTTIFGTEEVTNLINDLRKKYSEVAIPVAEPVVPPVKWQRIEKNYDDVPNDGNPSWVNNCVYNKE